MLNKVDHFAVTRDAWFVKTACGSVGGCIRNTHSLEKVTVRYESRIQLE